MTILLTQDELALVNNALNELCCGIRIDDDEFRIRTGFSRDEAHALLDRPRIVLVDLSAKASSTTPNPSNERRSR